MFSKFYSWAMRLPTRTVVVSKKEKRVNSIGNKSQSSLLFHVEQFYFFVFLAAHFSAPYFRFIRVFEQVE